MKFIALFGALAVMLNAQPPEPPRTQPTGLTLAWDASADPAVASYKVYEGTSSRSYTNSVTTGDTTLTLPTPDRSVPQYYTATAVDTNGIESDYSNEVLLPAVPPATNVVTVYLNFQVSTNGPNGPWSTWSVPMPTISMTNPPGASSFRSLMMISVTNASK